MTITAKSKALLLAVTKLSN